MPSKSTSAMSRLLIWAVGLALCGVLLYSQISFNYALGLFLPPPETEAQQVLVERVGEGPGARLILVGIPGADWDTVDAARVALEDSGQFARVMSSTLAPELSDLPDELWTYRYLLADQAFDTETLAEALNDRRKDMAVMSGEEFNYLLTHDPTFTAISLLEQMSAGSNQTEDWITEDGTGLLLVEGNSGAMDIAGQEATVAAIRSVMRDAEITSEPLLSGVGAFGVELKQTIHKEAELRSTLATLALLTVLIIAYRHWRPVLLSALPLLSGLVAGAATVALLFDSIHGITLAFGFTLMGVAIDYPLHLLSHARNMSGVAAIKNIWPTMRLGVLSTLLAYGAIAISGSEGSAQLGVFTAAGLLVAAAVTRYLLPVLTKEQAHKFDAAPTRSVTGSRLLPALLAFGLSFVLVALNWEGAFWSNNLADMSPVPKELLQRDREFRNAIGTPSLRYVIAVRGDDAQDVLERTESLDIDLNTALEQGWLEDWQAVTHLLPSKATQSRRQTSLPKPDALASNFAQAASSSPFAAGAFAPFIEAVGDSASLELIAVDHYKDSSLSTWIEGFLYATDGEVVSLFSLTNVKDEGALSQFLEAHPAGATLVDFNAASQSLVAEYRWHTLVVLLGALVLILALLLWRIEPARAIWALFTVLAVIFGTAGLVFALHGPLNLYHLMALLLVAGLGLDYVLFLSRNEESNAGLRDTRHAVVACAASTTLAFGVLAASAIPALQALGLTVSIGSAMSLLLAFVGVRRESLGG